MAVSSLSGLVAAFVAALAPQAGQPAALAAHAVMPPPAHIVVLKISGAKADKRTRTCNARGSQKNANPVERKLAPVACEQPPRSKVILTIDGGLFGSGR
jgi:hypothetical protein